MFKKIFKRPKLSVNLIGYLLTTYIAIYFEDYLAEGYLIILGLLISYFSITLAISIILHLNDFVKKIASIMNTKIIEKRNELISGRENK